MVTNFSIMKNREHRLRLSMEKVSRYIVRKSNVPITGKCSQSYCLSPFSTLPLSSIPRITLDFTHHFFSLFHPCPQKTFLLYRYNISENQFYPDHTVLSEINISWKCSAKYPIYNRHSVYFYGGIINIQSTTGKVYNLRSFDIMSIPMKPSPWSR